MKDSENNEFHKLITDLNSNSNEIYKLFIENLPNSILILDRDGKIIFVNESFEKFTGYQSKEIQGLNVLDILPSSFHPLIKEKLGHALQGEIVENLEYQMSFADGSLHELSTDTVPLKNNAGKVISLLTLTQDFTESNKNKLKLIESQQFLSNIVDLSPNAILVHSGGRILFSNPAGLKLSKAKSLEELYKIPIINFVHPDYRKTAIERVSTLEKNRKSVPPLKEKFVVLDGSTVDVEVRGEPIVYQNTPANLLIVRDLTKEQETEARKSAILRAIPDLMFVLNSDGVILDYNAPDETDLYVPSDKFKLFGSNMFDILPQEVSLKIHNCLKTTLETKKLQIIEYQLLVPKGYETFEARFVYSKENEVLAIVRNITQKKVDEQEGVRHQKIESLGLFAGGIAHDFNNLLTGILGNVNLLQLENNLPNGILSSLSDIEKAILRASHLTNQLLTFSKGGEPITRPESITAIIQDSISFVLSGSKSKVQTDFVNEDISVEVEAGQIYQLINNLVINADQSMPDGGIITINVTTINSDKEILPLGLTNHEYVKITIADEGVGIDNSVMDKIFDPYFTTKSSGTGLGLTTCYSIVKRHNGHIKVESIKDKGSKFIVYLPVSKKHTESGLKMLKTNKMTGHILIMDDDPLVQKSLGAMVKHIGFTYDIANNGQEAINLFRKSLHTKTYDFLIIDLTIPGGMSGKNAIIEIKNIDPNVKAIVSSGYFNDPVMANYKEFGFTGVLPKPYSLTILRSVISDVLATGEN